MAILILGLFDPDNDFLLVSDPSYIGITGASRIRGVRIIAVPSDENGLDPDRVEEAVRNCLGNGRPRALYDVPNFNNPMGTVLPQGRREALLDICAKYDMFFLEDNAYGAYVYDGERPGTLKASDRTGRVLYIGTFSKTLFPGLRLGFLVADQPVKGTGELLAKELSKIKSLLTGNSPPLLQAIAGGILLENRGSLQPILGPKVEHLRVNRDAMLQRLAVEFAGMEQLVSWNRPKGGFFITVTLPFPFGRAELLACAANFGVIVCPMRFFMLGPGREQQVRLSFSCLDKEQIHTGVRQFAAFVRDRISSEHPDRLVPAS
jgi:(S)-3,5-dihydroxyphenylglycine transaminase